MSCEAERLLVSQEELFCMELVKPKFGRMEPM
jgi:hypothetical protein